MSAQALLFTSTFDEQAEEASRRAYSRCMMCDGSGWRLVMNDTRGDRRVTRCECSRPQPGVRSRRPVVDHKAAAAGEERS
jgi:hypothetical protein